VTAAGEADFDAMVDEALAVEAVADAGGGEEVDSALFEDAGADTFLGIKSRAVFDDYVLDASKVKEVR
jgi:hypothetical protein